MTLNDQVKKGNAMQLEVIEYKPDNQLYETPLLFIHGAWHGAWCWDEYFMPYFRDEGYHVVALSLRGHAGSEGNLRWASGNDYVSDVHQIAQTLPNTPILIGHSMGGYITQKYIEQYPATAAIMVASIPSKGILPFILRLIRHHPMTMLRVGVMMSSYQLVRTPKLARQHFFSDTIPDAKVAQYHSRLNSESMRMMLDASLLNLPKPQNVPSDLPRLVVAGERDAVFTIAEEKSTAKAHNADFKSFDMAHDMMLEPNWQEVADHMHEWIQSL